MSKIRRGDCKAKTRIFRRCIRQPRLFSLAETDVADAIALELAGPGPIDNLSAFDLLPLATVEDFHSSSLMVLEGPVSGFPPPSWHLTLRRLQIVVTIYR